MHRSVFALALLVAASACSTKRRAPPPETEAAAPSSAESVASAAPALLDRAPKPGALKLVNGKKREINGVILVVGQGSESALKKMNASMHKDGGIPAPLLNAGEGVLYLPVKLGELRGWTAHFHLYRLSSELAAHALKPYVEHAHGVIVVEEEPSKSNWVPLVVGPLVKTRSPKPSVAILGTPALEQAWTAASDDAPIYVAAHSDNVLVPALKSVAKAILARAHEGEDAGVSTPP